MHKRITGELRVGDQRFALLVSRYNDMITARLRDAAVDTLKRHGCPEEHITEVLVPGAFELPLVAQKLAASERYDAIIALGCLIRGATAHFDVVSNEAAKGLAQVSLDHGVPVIFGVLTTHNIEQAVERAGGKATNRGAAAAEAAIEMVNLMQRLEQPES